MRAKIPKTRSLRSTSRGGHRTPLSSVVFPSSLGWMALIGSGGTLRYLTFGHSSAEAAVGALPADLAHNARPEAWNRPLVGRLEAYARGACDDFRDVEVDPGPRTEFQWRVLQCCRRIPYGKTLTYGQLAAKAGFPRSARAVGNCMASNPTPLVVPCHRVVATDGGLGGYSAAGGISMKQRLLDLEAKKGSGAFLRKKGPEAFFADGKPGSDTILPEDIVLPQKQCPH